MTSSFEKDIETMARTMVEEDPRRQDSDKYNWPNETVLVVQHTRLNQIYHNKQGQHAELVFLKDPEFLASIKPADQSSLEDRVDKLDLLEQMNEYKLYINYTPCGNCAKKILGFVSSHKSVKFLIHYAKTYRNGDGIRELKGKERIALATMNDVEWKSVITLMLDFYDQQEWKKKLHKESGYKSLQIVLNENWADLREKSDKKEKEDLDKILEKDCDNPAVQN